MQEGSTAIQKDLDKLEKWVDRNFKCFNKGKCKILHLGWNNPLQLYKLGASCIDSIFEEGDLMILVDNNLNMSHHGLLD